MNLLPIKQKQLFGLNMQFKEIVDLFDNNKLPNKILLSGPKGSGKATLAFHLINYIFSLNEENKYSHNKNKINDNNKSYKLINNGSHPNFHLIDLIDDKKNIEISQIRKMINYTNKSSFNDSPRIILIDNLENLNLNSSNALLKILEEPNEKVFFILILDSNKKTLQTIRSRCLNFRVNHNYEKNILITNKLINDDILNLLNKDLINYYITPGEFLNLINFSLINNIDIKKNDLNDFLNILIKHNFYKKDNFIKSYIFNYIELYFLKMLNESNNKNDIFLFFTKFIKKINDTKKFNLDVDTLFMEFQSKILNG
jgi:DNA polymerase III subunit delta'